MNVNSCFEFLQKFRLKHSHFRKNAARYFYNVLNFPCKVPVIILYSCQVLVLYFRKKKKKLKYQIHENPSVQWEPICSMRTQGWIDEWTERQTEEKTRRN
jgi:hypothetical protein